MPARSIPVRDPTCYASRDLGADFDTNVLVVGSGGRSWRIRIGSHTRQLEGS
jgi:hypothetical protein